MSTWKAKTASGTTYEFDTETSIVTRTLGEDSETMRRDGEQLTYFSTKIPRIGEPLEMMIDVRQDGVMTKRTTTELVELSGDVPTLAPTAS